MLLHCHVLYKKLSLLGFCLLSLVCHGQDDFRKEAHMYLQLLQKNHYAPRTLNDQLSADVFKSFTESLDEDGIYFTKADLNSLAQDKLLIDDDFKGMSWKVLPAVTELYKKKLLFARQTITDILSKPITYNSTETISFYNGIGKDSVTYTADDVALVKRWNKTIKYKILARLYNSDSIVKKEPEVREQVKALLLRTVNRVLENPGGFERYVATVYLRAFGSCFDAHTLYLSQTEWQNMQAELSPEGLSFGLELEDNDNGEIVIERLLPGGPAWKSNELHKGDIVTSLKWEGGETVDLMGAEAHEVYQMLNDANRVKLNLTARKSNGQTITVPLMKEKIREEDNMVKSYVLKGEKKIGYISLPGFYSEWDNATGNGCANDIAKEIVKLKEENIEGLILDVRSNGGGAMQEALALAGIFIEEGPLFMVKTKSPKPIVMKDINRGTVYDGPLAIMVDRESASASELVAGTLQDYHRAVIVGSRTFGKATTQAVLCIDTSVNVDMNNPADIKTPYGFANVTRGKLYRVTGKSCQLKGVVPDVALPDIYEAITYGESSYPFVLPNDSLDKKLVYNALPPLPLQELVQKSNNRISKDEGFMQVKKQVAQYAVMAKLLEKIPLDHEGYKKRDKEIDEWWEDFNEAVEEKTTIFTVENTTSETELLTADAYSKEINDIIITNLLEDLYLEETYLIMNDLIELTKK